MYSLRNSLLKPNDGNKCEPTPKVPVTFGILRTNKDKNKINTKPIKILFDSGASCSIIDHALTSNLAITNDSPTTWKTAAGTFKTNAKFTVELNLP